MNDKRIIVLLVRRAAGEINELELEELEGLLTNHPDAVYYEEFVVEMLAKNPDAEVPSESAYLRHKKRFEKELVFDEHSGGVSPENYEINDSRRIGRKAITVCFLVLFFTVFGIWFFAFRDSNVSLSSIEIVAERGMRKQFVLPDGTSVWLNSDSRLSYVDDMKSSKTRAVELVGEAFFDVAKDSGRPFIITTDKITIKVLGTAFNVKAYPTDMKTETSLIRGEIELSVNERPNEKILLKPNEKVALIHHPASVNSDGGDTGGKGITLTIGNLAKVQMNEGEYIRETSWVDDKLVFENETMEDLIPKLERWYNVDIEVQNQDVLQHRYTSTITKENIYQLLEALQFIHEFEFKIENNDVTIY